MTVHKFKPFSYKNFSCAAIFIALVFCTTNLRAQNYPLDAAYHLSEADSLWMYTPLCLYPRDNPRDDKVSRPLHMALKTNLLYDAMLLPNLSLEWYMGKKWSLAVEGNWSWWTFDSPVQNEWHHRIQSVGIELRYWFESLSPLHGHALGIYSTIGNYDIRLFPKDEFSKGYLSHRNWSAGLSYAYTFPIADRFNIELGLSVGYVGGRYYKYDYCMSHEYWANLSKHNSNYVGPTRVGVSLVWLFGSGNNKKNENECSIRE